MTAISWDNIWVQPVGYMLGLAMTPRTLEPMAATKHKIKQSALNARV